MAAVTAAVVGATVSVAALAHSIESSAQARRLAGQQRDRDNYAAKQAADELKLQDQRVKDTAQRDRDRANQRRRAAGLVSAGPVPFTSLGGAATASNPVPQSGAGTTIGG